MEDTWSIWFSGRPANKAGKAKDVYGTTVPMYIQRAQEGLRMTPNSSPQPQQQAPTGIRLTSSQDQNIPPHLRPFDTNVPVQDLSRKEIDALMRWNGVLRPPMRG